MSEWRLLLCPAVNGFLNRDYNGDYLAPNRDYLEPNGDYLAPNKDYLALNEDYLAPTKIFLAKLSFSQSGLPVPTSTCC
jgi:hypothetical protein